ncbi:unnamed protein product [Acanthoscelides obtectus]|uniref:RNase H type-1 domain-containing protein n=1 Tax=Acanthoscelides obtectus TaxID=200917 RepID=A0A9P0VUX7_ACAOB|nr:unnamed protein product [Acanthoscelides obtectus]CAK1685469.1 Pol polyprotein [Acanthoscelides obtectus]
MPVYPLKNEAPSWQIPSAQVNTELTKFHKKETPTVQLRSHFQGILEQYTCAETIYTDGSKTASGVGCSIIINGVAHLWTLPPMTSIFTAEQYAILQALKYCQIESKSNLTLIVSDSLSTLNAMSNRYSRDPLILACLQTLKVLMDGDKRVVFIWVPGHVGILGNELADQSARQAAAATGIDCTIVKAPDLKMKIRQCITEAWQRQWNNELTQLRTIKPDVTKWTPNVKMSREEAVRIHRLRLGHTALTHSYLLSGQGHPNCPSCEARLTAMHIMRMSSVKQP